MVSLRGKVALVTGGSRGIGASICRRLARDGAVVLVNYVSNRTAAEAVVREIEAAGGEAEATCADVAVVEDVSRMVSDISTGYGRLDILVNNAGVAEFVPLDKIDTEHIDRIFNVNVKGLLTTTRLGSQFMPDGGRIINISSGSARATPPGAAVYAASKAAVEALTSSLSKELGSRMITVNCVSPGITETDMLNAVIPTDVQLAMAARTSLRRIGQPEDIADVVAFLASNDARWITGQVIAASGGLT